MSDTLNLAECGQIGRPSVDAETAKAFLVAAALQQLDRVQSFIEAGGLHPDTTYGGKPTALCYAVLKPHPVLATYLLDKGADIHRRDGMGMTPLHYAALGGCVYCAACLVGRGACLNAENCRGQTPLTLTLEKPHLGLCREFLTRHGAAHCQADPGATQFH